MKRMAESYSDKCNDEVNDDEVLVRQEPDLEYIRELLEHIDRDPFAHLTHLLLMQHYNACGWYDAAEEYAQQALKVNPSTEEALQYIKIRRQKALGSRSKTRIHEGGPKVHDCRLQHDQRQTSNWRPRLVPIRSQNESLKQLEHDYKMIVRDAESLLADMEISTDFDVQPLEQERLNVMQVAKGRLSSALRPRPIAGIDTVAKSVVENKNYDQNDQVEIILKDLKDFASWLRKSDNNVDPKGGVYATTEDSEGLREALFRRSNALKSILPGSLKLLAELGMMHAEREILDRTYVNKTTMVLDEQISDISRANFWASEDGYAWNMEELAAAIRSADGVMRNPLSRQMFSRDDIRAIIKHPLGRDLQALQVEQSKLKRGVRDQTIRELDKLAKVLLTDSTETAHPSRLAIEIFMSYLETLPDNEQQTIDKLQISARDSHSGIPFDTTIKEAVDDLVGNRVCSHKIGDFLSQAAAFLTTMDDSGTQSGRKR